MPRTRPASESASRPQLSRERIESEALVLIEEQGMEGFSTRKLGQRLGCEAMSIYHHFPSKAHLLDALVDRSLGQLPIPPRHWPPERRIRALAQAWREMAGQHPRFYLWMALHRWNSRTGVNFLAQVLDCFYAAGLSPAWAARGFRAIGYYLLGATLEETSGYSLGPSALNPMPDEDIERLHPAVAASAPYFQPEQYEATYELGLGILLRGLGIASQSDGRTPSQSESR